MKKTVMTILESIADKLGDEVRYKFLKELEEIEDKRLGYDYDSYMLAFLPFDEIQERLLGEFVHGIELENNWTFDDTQSFKVGFVYQHYDFVNAQLEELITKYEGSPCCHDKSSTLVRMYIRYLATGELPNVTKGDKEFWKPACGTAEQWMNLVDSTVFLHQGKPEAYFEAYREMTKTYEKWFEEKRERIELTLRCFPYFVGGYHEDDGLAYDFEKEGVKATVILDNRLQIRYRYLEPGMEDLSRKVRLQLGVKPWFKDLLNQLN